MQEFHVRTTLEKCCMQELHVQTTLEEFFMQEFHVRMQEHSKGTGSGQIDSFLVEGEC